MLSGARWLMTAIGGLLLLFGLGCLNYTKAFTLERHQRFASLHNLPPPQPGIFYGGCASLVAGAGAIGYAVGRGRQQA